MKTARPAIPIAQFVEKLHDEMAQVFLETPALDGWPGLLSKQELERLLGEMPQLEDRYVSYFGRRISQRSTYPGMPQEVERPVLASLLGPQLEIFDVEKTWGGFRYSVRARSGEAKPFTIESHGDGEGFSHVQLDVSDRDQARRLYERVLSREDAVRAEIERVRQSASARSTISWIKAVIKGSAKQQKQRVSRL